MSKFELSDKELKQLLQNEGLEEPSMSFNRMILEKAQAFEQTRSIKTPLALKIAFGVLMLIPLFLIFGWGGGGLIHTYLDDLQGRCRLSPTRSIDLPRHFIDLWVLQRVH